MRYIPTHPVSSSLNPFCPVHTASQSHSPAQGWLPRLPRASTCPKPKVTHTTHLAPSPRGKTTANKHWGFFLLQNYFFLVDIVFFFFPFSFYSKHCKYRNISLYNRTTVYSGGRAGRHTPGPRHPWPSAGTALPAPKVPGAPGPSRRPPGRLRLLWPSLVAATKRRTKQNPQKATDRGVVRGPGGHTPHIERFTSF